MSAENPLQGRTVGEAEFNQKFKKKKSLKQAGLMVPEEKRLYEDEVLFMLYSS